MSDQRRGVLKSEFFFDAFAISADGFDAQMQFAGNLFGRQTLANGDEYFQVTIRALQCLLMSLIISIPLRPFKEISTITMPGSGVWIFSQAPVTSSASPQTCKSFSWLISSLRPKINTRWSSTNKIRVTPCSFLL